MTEVRNEYTEVLELLKNISKEDYSKIPQEKIEFYEKYKNPDFECCFDNEKDFVEQNFSRKAYVILLRLYMDHVLSEDDRKIVDNIVQQNDKKAKKEKKIGFVKKIKEVAADENTDDLDEEENQIVALDNKKNNIFKTIIAKIKSIFGK